MDGWMTEWYVYIHTVHREVLELLPSWWPFFYHVSS
jgi:hypothetical protein